MRILFVLLALCVSAVTARAATPVEVDRIVAIVNDQAITLFELRERVTTIKRQLSARNTPLPPDSVLSQQILERMIVEQAQMQHARETGLQVADDELDAALRRIAENNKFALPEFRMAVERDGVNWNRFREDVRKEILLSRLRERDVDSRISVTDGEVDNYLATVSISGDPDVQLNIAHIVVRVPDQVTPEQLRFLREKAESALSQLRQGEDFGKVAAGFSDAPDGLSGGVLGLRAADRLPGLYVEEVRKLKPGETSTVFRSPAGFHIIKLLQRQGGTENLPPINQTHARHILIKVDDLVSDAEAKRKMEGLRERLVNGGDFAALAKLYSNDLSASKGGDLGWMNQGDTVPEFERAMDSLKIGEISEPVKSPFGYHLIQVLERRTDEGSPERKRLAARRALRERKADEAYEDWIRQVRDRAYVEYKLEDR